MFCYCSSVIIFLLLSEGFNLQLGQYLYIESSPTKGKSFIKRFVPSCLLLSSIVASSSVTTFAFSIICRCSCLGVRPSCLPSVRSVSRDYTLHLASAIRQVLLTGILALGIMSRALRLGCTLHLVSAMSRAVRLDSPLYKNYHTF